MKKNHFLFSTVVIAIVGLIAPLCFAPPSGEIEWDFCDNFNVPIGGDAPMWIDPDGGGGIDPFQVISIGDPFNPGAYSFTNPDGLGHLAYTTNTPGDWGEEFGVEVMCDMTTNGGGWTLLGGIAGLVDDTTGDFYYGGIKDDGFGNRRLCIGMETAGGGWTLLSEGTVPITPMVVFGWIRWTYEPDSINPGKLQSTLSLYDGNPDEGGIQIDQISATNMSWLKGPGQGYMGVYAKPGVGSSGGPWFDKFYQYKNYNDQIRVYCTESLEPTGGWRYGYSVQIDGYLKTLGVGSGVSSLMHYRSIWGPTHDYGISYNYDPNEWPCSGPGASPHGAMAPAPNGFCEYPFWWWNIHPSSYDFGFVAPSSPHDVTWKASGMSYHGIPINDESDWSEPVGLGDGPVHGPDDNYDPDNLPYGFIQAIPISIDHAWWFNFTGIPVRPITGPIWRLYGDDVIDSDLYFSDPTATEPVFNADMLTPGKEYLLGVVHTNTTSGPQPYTEGMFAPVRLDCPEADLSGDCYVDFIDFAMFAQQWLTGDGIGGP